MQSLAMLMTVVASVDVHFVLQKVGLQVVKLLFFIVLNLGCFVRQRWWGSCLFFLFLDWRFYVSCVLALCWHSNGTVCYIIRRLIGTFTFLVLDVTCTFRLFLLLLDLLGHSLFFAIDKVLEFLEIVFGPLRWRFTFFYLKAFSDHTRQSWLRVIGLSSLGVGAVTCILDAFLLALTPEHLKVAILTSDRVVEVAWITRIVRLLVQLEQAYLLLHVYLLKHVQVCLFGLRHPGLQLRFIKVKSQIILIRCCLFLLR